MNSVTSLDPMEVYERGLRDPEALTPAERLVYILLELDTYADMEGWDHFFTTDRLRYYPELKAGLAASHDSESLEVLQDYERHLTAHGVHLEAEAIERWVCARSDDELAADRDWREDYSKLGPARWEKVKAYLRRNGVAME